MLQTFIFFIFFASQWQEKTLVKEILVSLPVEEAALLKLSLVTAATRGSLTLPPPPLYHYRPLPPLLTPPPPPHPPGSQGALTLIGGLEESFDLSDSVG